jgi:hypothetical protein
LYNFVYGIALRDAGDILVAGTFTKYILAHSYGVQTSDANRFARLNADGSRGDFYSQPPHLDGAAQVYAMVLDGAGRLVLGGSFSKYGNRDAGNLSRIKINGVVDSGFNIGTGTDGAVRALAVQGDGRVIAGGNFTKVNGVSTGSLIRLNP